MPDSNNWGTPYSSIQFFERALKNHQRVNSYDGSDDIFFTIERTEGLSTVTALLVDVYTVGLADLFRAKDEFPLMEHLVTCSNWNAYTPQAKEYGMNNGIGIFVLGEFLGALWLRDPLRYAKKDDRGNPVYHYRVA